MTTHIDPEYQASAIEPQVQKDWEDRKSFKVADTVEGPSLYPLDVPLSKWQTAYGSCAELYDWRCD
jgi:hypothetical protein